ncbi:hypothetical protein ABI_26510 [Asticcacaulis biprosthecium C19]|uniref:Uncharacterized protein n=1 Tax=Asticcacaulis biprosthecium C19 TaxID=715226 RepID=F4QPH8_9CAUL|nr:hypothetical protein [Asticcacaulis biprosthecium]EGF91236.1 hypothetical protein ABI_26510 [Asticcacaulis biprosthecium C19]
MSAPEVHTTDLLTQDATGRIFLTLAQDDAAEIVERLRETHADLQGRAYLIRLDILVERLGARWEIKRDLVFDHLKTTFERKFKEPDWCIKINDDSFLAVILTLGEYKGALSAAELWYAAGQFFVGDVSGAPPPLFEALADDVDRLRLIPIDLNTYFDRADARPFRATEAPLPQAASDAAPRAATSVGTMVAMRRPSSSGAAIMVGGRELRIASALEPVFEMKKLAMIGHRFEPTVTEATGFPLDARAIAGLDWGDREQVDLANIEQGLKLLKMRHPDQRKMVMMIPAAFSTFASAKARARLMPMVSQAAQEMRLKVLFEIRHLNGVPQGRAAEVVSMLKPYCMTALGHAGAEPRAISGLRDRGLAGAVVDYDGARRDDGALEVYLTTFTAAARAATGACMIQGFDSLRQMAVARLAGVSHASLKASALTAARG